MYIEKSVKFVDKRVNKNLPVILNIQIATFGDIFFVQVFGDLTNKKDFAIFKHARWDFF